MDSVRNYIGLRIVLAGGTSFAISVDGFTLKGRMAEMTPNLNSQSHPTDLIAALNGGDRIFLGGFGAEAIPHSWVRPGVRFIGVVETPVATVEIIRNRNRILKLFQSFLILLVLASGIGLGIWIGPKYQNAKDYPIQNSAWVASSVSIDGVLIQMGDKLILVKNGMKLPNGEYLLSTMPQKRAYITNKSTTVINGPDFNLVPVQK